MKVRAITAGAPLRLPLAQSQVAQAGTLIDAARGALAEAGMEVQTTRLATPPLETMLPPEAAGSAGPIAAAARDLAAALETCCQAEGIEYAALGAIDTLAAGEAQWRPLLETIPELIERTERLFCAASVASRAGGISLAAARACGEAVVRIAARTPNGFGNLRFAALANCPPHIPFFPAAYHDGQPRLTLGLALEAADLAVAAFDGAATLDQAGGRLVESLAGEVARVCATVERALQRFDGVELIGADLSLAPFPADARSIAAACERLGLPAFGTPGTLFIASFLTGCLRRAAAEIRRRGGRAPAGFSGLMLPVLEDAVLARRAAEGSLGVESLLLYSAVCGLGLDTVPLPGETPPEVLAALVLDVAALAVRLDKPLTARLFPVPGKRAGDPVAWDFAYFAPSRILALPARVPGGALAATARYNPAQYDGNGGS